MCAIAPAVQPDKARAAIYSRKYDLYCKTISALDPLWEHMQRLIEGNQQELPFCCSVA